jgi:hypothetical protein
MTTRDKLMAAPKRTRAPRARKADESDPQEADKIEGRLLMWIARDKINTIGGAGEPQKRAAVEKVLFRIAHFRRTVLPGRRLRDGDRPADGAGSGWSLSADQPKPSPTNPGFPELAAWEALLESAFTDAETAELTDPGGDGAARVEKRRFRRRKLLAAEGGADP